ncbi:MAG: 3-oxoacyl-ACP reductase FabG [Desulfobacterales bacterium]|nr:3-oxoacyl-ACP reductase FabG [Desulfobacterales bacterium]
MTNRIEQQIESSSTRNKKVALVTGGGKGIGAAISRALSKQGFFVGIHFRESENAARNLLSQLSGPGFLLKADLSEKDHIDDMVQKIKKEAGRVDVLVNNAGVSINTAMAGMKIEDFDTQRSILRGAWYLTKRVLRVFMLRQKAGRIINISSVTGHTGNAGQIPYTMEKAAMDAMTKSLSKELHGRNILVNSIAPGFIDTDMTMDLPGDVHKEILGSIPMGRMGTPEEVAEVAAFLAQKGGYINGSVIHVNGGLYGG